MRTGLFVITTCVGLVSGGATSAQPPGRDPIALLDRDKSGSVSLEESRVRRPDVTAEQFAKWDADKSGALNQEELTVALRELLAADSRPL